MQLETLVGAHVEFTGSARGRKLLANWDEAIREFWILRPALPRALEDAITAETIDAAAP